MRGSQPSGRVQPHSRTSALRRWNLQPREGAILAAIALAAIAVYLPSLRNDWVFDDWDQIVGAKLLHSWTGIGKSFIHDSWWFRHPAHLPQSAYYRPFQASWFGLNFMLLGNHPAAWRLEKIVLELIAVMLSFRLAQLLTRNSAVALLSAAFFALLPANVESVVWVSAIGEPLATIFELGALCCFINRKPGWSRGLNFALMLYAGALLSHETAILFPLIVAAYVFLIERAAAKPLPESSRSTATILARGVAAARVAAPFGLLAIAYLCARIEVLGLNSAFSSPHPVALAQAQTASPYHGPVDYLLTLPVVLLAYLSVLAVPGFAGPAHHVVWITSASPIAFVAAGILAILALFALILVWRSSDRRLYLFCAAWSVMALAPAMKLNSIWALVQDRCLYAPSFGWSLALALAAVRLAAASPRARATVAAVTALLLAAYMVTAIRIEHFWRDDLTFFQQCVAVDPANVEYRRRLADAMDKAGDFAAAARELERAAALHPDDAYLHLRLGQEYMRLRRRADFEREFQKYYELLGIAIPPSSVAETSSAAPPAGPP